MAKLARGTVVKIPDEKWISAKEWERSARSPSRAKLHRSKGIVLAATKKTVLICYYNPGEKPGRPGGRDQPWITKYATGSCARAWKDPSNCIDGFKIVGKVKRVPKGCNRAHRDKAQTMARYGGMSIHTASGFKPGGGGLEGARRRRRRRG